MRRPQAHIVGAGVSGLSAAVRMAEAGGFDVTLHERADRAGGKRRSVYDSVAGLEYEGGVSFALAGWRAFGRMLDTLEAADRWRLAEHSELAFVDLASNERWTLSPNPGPLPWWPMSARRRAPRTAAPDYLSLARLAFAPRSARLAAYVPREGAAAERLWRPLSLACLNIDPTRASARLAGAQCLALLRAGEAGARLRMPAPDFSRAFVGPALKYLRRKQATIRFDREVVGLDFAGDRVAALEFESDRVDLQAGDVVILATPPDVASALAPGLTAPQEFTATLTVHYYAAPASPEPCATGVVNGAFHWLFRAPDRVSAVVRDAGAWMEIPRETVAAELWPAVAALTGLPDDMPPWRLIRQKRATFAATPEQDALRPPCQSPWPNLLLAGSYVANGLPSTLEASVRSGELAAAKAREV